MIIEGKNTNNNEHQRKYASQLNDFIDSELFGSNCSFELNSHDFRDDVLGEQYTPQVMNAFPKTIDSDIGRIMNNDYIFMDIMKKLTELKKEIEVSEERIQLPFTEKSLAVGFSYQPRYSEKSNNINPKTKLDKYSILCNTGPEQFGDDQSLIVNYHSRSSSKRKKLESTSKTTLKLHDLPIEDSEMAQISDSHVTAGRFVNMRKKGKSGLADNDSRSPFSSASLYVDPYLGCNQDCTGTKMGVIGEKRHVEERNADNASTVPLYHNESLFHDYNELTTSPSHHHEKPLRNFKYNFCDCNNFLDVDSIRDKRNAIRHEGIPHKTCRYYSVCRDFETVPCSMSHENMEKKYNLHEDPVVERKKKKRHCTMCKSGDVDKDELGKTEQAQAKIDHTTSHVCKCSAPKVYCEDFKIPGPPRKVHNNGAKRHIHRKVHRSIGCQARDSSNRNIEVGRNITIQIIPNNYQSPYSNNSPTYHKTEYTQSPCNDSMQPAVDIQVIKQESEVFHKEILEEKSRSSSSQRQYWWACSWRRKKDEDPYYRRHKKHKNATDNAQLLEPNDYGAKPPPNYATFPIENIDDREHFLKSFHSKMNKGLIRDLFATPTPSLATACSPSCVQRIRGAPYPMCCGDPTSYCCPRNTVITPHNNAITPVTTNQFSQSEPKVIEQDVVMEKDRIFFECMKYLMNKVACNEKCCDNDDDEEDCWCCCQSYNCCHCQLRPCCCCCSRRPERKIECKGKEKKTCPCTCSRFVECKQTVKDFGVNVSPAEKNIKTMSTNTEPPKPKTPKQKKCRCCCKPRCCCCRRMPTCCYEQCCCDCGSKFEHNDVREPFPKQERSVFCCNCNNYIPRYPESKPNTPLHKVKSKPNTSTVALQTKSASATGSKPKKTTHKSVDTRNDELIQRDDVPKFKGLSKNHHNPWNTKTFPHVQNETYRMNLEELYRVPWHDFSKKPHDIVPKNLVRTEQKSPEEDTVSKIQYLSGIFEAILTSREKTIAKFKTGMDSNISNVINDEILTPSLNKEQQVFTSDKSSMIESTKIEDTDDVKFEPITEKIANKTENHTKNTENKIGTMSTGINPTLSNMYTSRPFTTKTGLMSYIPPNRDSFLNCSISNERASIKKDIKLTKRSVQNQSSNPKIAKTILQKPNTNSSTSTRVQQKENINTNTKFTKILSNSQSSKQIQGRSRPMTTLFSHKKEIKTPESTVRNIESKKMSNIFKKYASEIPQIKFLSPTITTGSFLDIKDCNMSINDSFLESLCNNCIEDSTLKDFLFL